MEDVLNSLNDKTLVAQIIYDYPEMPRFLSQLYLDYFTKYITSDANFYQNYIEEIESICTIFEVFLQAYSNSLEEQS